MLQIVRSLDKAMNNTSILLFEVGGKSLLFPGDAQIENWSYALSQTSVVGKLKAVDVYKVGHHGSLNATPISLWETFDKRSKNKEDKKRLVTLMSTLAGKHGHEKDGTEVPRTRLVRALASERNISQQKHWRGKHFFHDETIAIN